ncbi:hypothetical protein TNCV_826411 [Trichonephila clavipes]|nr:hypothetical protein TNCV_826411 [Trichonephila clavipes]
MVEQPQTNNECCIFGDDFPDGIDSIVSDCRGILVTELAFLNHGQVTRTTPELAFLSSNFHTTSTGGLLSLSRFNGHLPLHTVGLQRY